MNNRARLQLRLQQTVEGLSVAAVSYYVVGLIGYLAKGASIFGDAGAAGSRHRRLGAVGHPAGLVGVRVSPMHPAGKHPALVTTPANSRLCSRGCSHFALSN